jgi:hypothetical protein
MRIVGRDFAYSLSSTASSVTGWELIGGMPVTPSVLASSGLRAFVQSYGFFKVNKILFHYITSSPTSQAGDVLFYYNRTRIANFPDWSNANFLPYVLSDPKTILGPQWTNHSALVVPAPEWKSTNYGGQNDIDEDSCGEMVLFSKTNATNSPGYILIDYDITFRELCVNPRAGVLPISRGLYLSTGLGATAYAVTAGSSQMSGSGGLQIQGKSISNVTSTAPTGIQAGDVYKVVVSATMSPTINTFTNCSLSNILTFPDSSATAYTVDDGFTFYALYNTNNARFDCYPTLAEALAGNKPFYFGVTATITFTLCVTMSLVANTGTALQTSY